MKIIKYKKGAKGIYKVTLDNDMVLSLYEDVILKFNLLLTKEIKECDLQSIYDYNFECDVYYVALNNIKTRFKSIYELSEYLRKKEFPIDLIDKAIDKLINQGYLNDRLYSRSYINNQIITSSKGPFKLLKELSDKKIDSLVIKEELEVFNEDLQISKINKIVNKLIKSNHTRGGYVLKQKIYNDLINYGYSSSLINDVLNNYSFDNDKDLAKKEYEKLYKKYSRKYSGAELTRKIKEKLYLKGLKYEE